MKESEFRFDVYQDGELVMRVFPVKDAHNQTFAILTRHLTERNGYVVRSYRDNKEMHI